MIDNRNRAFHFAVLASLALHALLLFAFPELVDTARRVASLPPQIIARLMEPEPAAVPAPALPAQPLPQAPPPAKKAAPRLVKPAPERAPELEPAREPEAPPAAAARPEPAATPPEARADPMAAEQALASPPTAGIPPGPVSAAPAAEPTEARVADQYRLELVQEARRIKDRMRYPPLARDNRWEGDVLIGVVVRANGRATVSIRAGSGHDILDRQAVEIYREATQRVSIPAALRGKESALKDLPVEYRLTD